MSVFKIAVFRFEASQKTGAGHAIRSSVLAEYLQKINYVIYIASSKDTYNFIPLLSIYKRIEPEKLIENDFACDILFIDSYDIDLKLETQYRKHAKKIVVIDDLANRHHDCDILIDQTFGRLPVDYQKLVPKGCKILTGSSFALIRDDFLKYREGILEKRMNKKKISKVLISLGGADQKKYTQKILEQLIQVGYNGEIDIVIGFANNIDQFLLNLRASLANIINFHVNPDMAKLMYEADFAITASGSSVWERACLALPGVLILTAKNQSEIFNRLIEKNFFYTIGDLNHALENSFKTLTKIFSLTDGKGSAKVMNAILNTNSQIY